MIPLVANLVLMNTNFNSILNIKYSYELWLSIAEFKEASWSWQNSHRKKQCTMYWINRRWLLWIEGTWTTRS